MELIQWSGNLGGVGSKDMEIAHIDYFEMFDYEDEARNRVLARERYVVQDQIFLLKITDHMMCNRV